MVKGFKFKVGWRGTSLIETVNASSFEVAEIKIARKYRTAMTADFLGETDPLPIDTWMKGVKKVF